MLCDIEKFETKHEIVINKFLKNDLLPCQYLVLWSWKEPSM